MATGSAGEDRYTARSYFALVEDGLLDAEERVELLDGIIVSKAPHTPAHAGGIRRVDGVLRAALGAEVVYSPQMPLVAGTSSVPEPDFAVLSGRLEDYSTQHPTSALLVVEVADSSLPQDRLTKTRIYARAGIANYWIVNLRDNVIEWFADPDIDARIYRSRGIAAGSEPLPLAAFPDVTIRAAELLPSA
jgi:Uma2 family endonuclease